MIMKIGKCFITVVFLIFSAYLHACDCEYRTIKQKIESADIVVIGTVKKITDIEESCFNGDCLSISIEVKIEIVVKGKEKKNIIFVQTMKRTASCGYPFIENKTYLIFLEKSKKRGCYFCSLCSGTILL